MRIVVHGQQAFGKAVLEALLKRGEDVVAVYVAPEKEGAKADPLKEAALAAKINCFPQHTFDIRGVSIGGADLATVLNRKCVAHQAIPRNRAPIKSSEPTETPGQASPEPSPPAKSQETPEPNNDDPDSQGPQPKV